LNYNSIITIILASSLGACMPTRKNDVEYPQVGGQGADQNNAGQNGEVRNEPTDSRGKLKMNLPIAALEALEIDTDALFYTVKYADESGKELASRPRTKLAIDPQTKAGAVELKVPDQTSGFVTMTLEEETQGGAKFEGKSDKVTVNGPTKVSLKLKLLDNNADVSVDVTFDGDQGSIPDPDPNPDPDPDPGPDVSGIANAELRALVKTVGAPKDMGTPTYAKLKPVIDRFCGDCHVPGRAFGDSGNQNFFAQRRIKSRLGPKTMPSPGSPYASDMDTLAAAGFDYRQAMIDLAASLGNNN
jgi:hypothetical protein